MSREDKEDAGGTGSSKTAVDRVDAAVKETRSHEPGEGRPQGL
jgi:hypothetical protein